MSDCLLGTLWVAGHEGGGGYGGSMSMSLSMQLGALKASRDLSYKRMDRRGRR